jgi:glycosyltransferase involved in cell wall biosynthesis/spore maturation protein CgeB/SAM-dependent methyltransferase
MHDENEHEADGHDDAQHGAGSPWLDRVNDAYYDRLGEGMGRRTRDRINWMCTRCEGHSVLDIGCSQGITSILLGREGFRVLGIDIVQEAIDFASRELAVEPEEVRARVGFQRMDLLSTPVGEGYDNVVLGEVVEHQTSASRFLKAAARHVAPGGRMIVTVPFGLHPFPDHKCTVFPRDVVDALGDGFAFDCLEVVDGYVRVVATRAEAGGVAGVTRDRLLDATEAGSREAQARYFEILEKSRALQATRKEQTQQLKALHEKHGQLTLEIERSLSRSREDMAQLKSQLLTLRHESLRAEEEAATLRSQVGAANAKLEAMRHESLRAQEEAGALRSQVGAANVDKEALQKQLAEKAMIASRVPGLDKKLAHMADYRRRLEHQHETVKSWLSDSNQELAFLKESVSFRLGTTLMSALRSPRDFVALPIRLGRLFSNGLRRRAARRAMPRAVADAKEDDPGAAGWRHRNAGIAVVDGGRTAKDRPPVALSVSNVSPVTLTVGPALGMLPRPDAETAVAVVSQAFPERISELRVAAIMDDFTRESFRHCCQLRQLTPDGWQSELAEFRPHIVLVESAWRGEADRWARKVYPLSKELAELVAWARREGIPTAFWNKEDPVHFSVFLATARLFDHVFTTDIDCIKSYRNELGHDRVHLLPFACEPRTHNPVEAYARTDGFCFAGSYYVKYPERQRDFASLVDALREVRPVDIFDRNHGKDEPSLAFPEAYLPLIRGNLPYDQIDRAYKGYRYGININTVKQSQSMFARRAFDLLASNTVTVSNFSRGLRLMFGDLIVSTDDGAEAVRRLAPLLQDDAAYRKYRLQGLRKVLSEHTYEDRLAFVLDKISGRQPAPMLPEIVVVAAVADAAALARVLAGYHRQAYARKRLVLVSGDPSLTHDLAGHGDIEAMGARDAAQVDPRVAFAGAFVAYFAADDYYGAHYLTDLALATRYSMARVIGKAAHHAGDADGRTRLVDGACYASAGALPLRAAMVDAACLDGRMLGSLVETGGDLRIEGVDSLAIDEFNYCRHWQAADCADVDDPVLNSGIELARLQAMAEAEAEAGDGRDSGTTFVGYGAQELAALFPAGEYAGGRVRLEASEDGVGIASKLGEHNHAYVYAEHPVALDTLFRDEIGRFNMLVTSDMLLSITLIFLDGEQQRIGHVIRACNSNQSVMPLEGTRYVMLGIRVQGAGLATLRRLVLQHVPPAIDALAGSARCLLVSRSYPGYDNLYNYTFVHRRARGYREHGLALDVFRFSDAPLAYEEFEGIDIVSGNVGDLSLMLRSNPYETILVHSFDEQVWSAIQPHLAHARVVVWVHGAEIQPWYRRDFNFGDDGERRRGIQRSDMRMSLWRQVLEDMPPNLHLVFVSEFLARQAMRDLDVEVPPHQYSVIHNVVDGELFDYIEKPVEQRDRILSIRPYTKPTYANDLAVKAIQDLAGEPWFGELAFRLVGDGPLFESTVAPLRQGFPNVVIEKGFLTQQQITELYKQYGVFLVPSRIDSQGVSRDEAMASGLVPVTNRVSAIPEFVDEDVAFLAPAEDWRALADAIRALHADPQRFQRMSRAAAIHVRAKSGPAQTLLREIALIRGRIDAQPPVTREDVIPSRRIAVYGDLNLNLIDGSAVWAASLVQVLAGLEDVAVDLFLKTRLRSTQVLGAVLDLPNVRLVEPGLGGESPPLEPDEAVARILAADAGRHYDAIILRGHRLCVAAARHPALAGRLWVYLTDIPQQASLLDASWRSSLADIAAASRYVLCQTAALEELLQHSVPAMQGKTRRLPPMVPPLPAGARRAAAAAGDGVLRMAYAGKFAPLWGIREMLEVADRLAERGVRFELHVYGDKIHNPADDPGFRDEVRERLDGTAGVTWHRGVARTTLLEALRSMDLGWAWRSPELEDNTLELSTKVLEYGLCGLPVLMARGPANVAAFGDDYPLFARTTTDIVDLLATAASDRGLLRDAGTRTTGVAAAHTFDRIRAEYLAPLMAAQAGDVAGAS